MNYKYMALWSIMLCSFAHGMGLKRKKESIWHFPEFYNQNTQNGTSQKPEKRSRKTEPVPTEKVRIASPQPHRGSPIEQGSLEEYALLNAFAALELKEKIIADKDAQNFLEQFDK